jgi:uncharacterized protein
MSRSLELQAPTMPWWRVRMVWLVIGGPLAVVVASFVTLFLALAHPDPVLGTHEPRSVAAGSPGSDAYTPAVAARNHAATSTGR